MIKAIETTYGGYRFRSRLEARWAVFMDSLGIGWEYEPEGYETSAGRYLPDFRIVSGMRDAVGERGIYPERPILAEVKGVIDPPVNEVAKVHALTQGMLCTVLLFGPFPRARSEFRGRLSVNSLNGPFLIPAYPNLIAVTWDFSTSLCEGTDYWSGDDSALWSVTQQYGDESEVCYALDAARRARFEHGETPARLTPHS